MRKQAFLSRSTTRVPKPPSGTPYSPRQLPAPGHWATSPALPQPGLETGVQGLPACGVYGVCTAACANLGALPCATITMPASEAQGMGWLSIRPVLLLPA